MTFARSLSIKSELTEDISREVRKLGIRIDQGVVLGTPVDTGRARANWLVGIGTAPVGTTENLDQVGNASIQAAVSIIGNYPADKLPDLWIVNNLPYIDRLNDGWSERSNPRIKWVEAAIDRALENG
jgi:hypothetical protein